MMDFIPYGRQSIDQSDIDAVTAVLRSDWLTTGPAVAEFEEALAAMTGAHAIAVANGTAALQCAYVAAGIDGSADVVTTPMTFVATAAAAMTLGATVTFADVSDDTLNLDPAAAEVTISNRTRAVAVVDFAGHPADLDPLRKIAHAHDALLVEDAAHAIGGSYRDRPIGSVADLTTFSFHPVKTITTGEGGAVTAPDPDLLA
ncbi:MAG: aminotransferase class V-fold PLP-dependent enzyme, partial [Acidimicrobiia bacterium]|nr:aminotransferase class V-fold PLP-dependent enzyme [Acidimicrobiia bacterium]